MSIYISDVLNLLFLALFLRTTRSFRSSKNGHNETVCERSIQTMKYTTVCNVNLWLKCPELSSILRINERHSVMIFYLLDGYMSMIGSKDTL